MKSKSSIINELEEIIGDLIFKIQIRPDPVNSSDFIMKIFSPDSEVIGTIPLLINKLIEDDYNLEYLGIKKREAYDMIKNYYKNG
jgi:hypothetical protein